MKIKMVPRAEISSSRKKSSKYAPLIEALSKLRPGGDAIQVKYGNEKELSSARNVVYAFNREYDKKVKSRKDTQNKTVFFYLK
ncbi:MAG TPA: hypothetical protein DEQ34_14675 [Balneolaceae bacterium]|nr:hypothetical protein [Balneolaceae bacterium]|tara:strand:+ start:23554 stop:23802 length:249 start_codon:yes stop_codon:yes gene_type:complete